MLFQFEKIGLNWNFFLSNGSGLWFNMLVYKLCGLFERKLLWSVKLILLYVFKQISPFLFSADGNVLT